MEMDGPDDRHEEARLGAVTVLEGMEDLLLSEQDVERCFTLLLLAIDSICWPEVRPLSADWRCSEAAVEE